jgi:hypothetical protein
MMIHLFNGAKSISGHPLASGNIMRIVYLDEAGTSQNESVTLVVGAIINADLQVIQIQDYLNSLIEKCIPQEDRGGFVFHAKDIFHGSGYFSDRVKWSFETRIEILKDILASFQLYKIPISIGYFIDPDISQGRSIIIRHAMAYMECFAAIETYMRNFAPNELAMVIAEDHPTMKKYLQDIHQDFVGKLENPIKNVHRDIIPIRHIHGTINFAEKNQSALLQIADTFAFIIRRHLMGGSRVDELMSCILPEYQEAFKPSGVCGHKFIVLKTIDAGSIYQAENS